MKPVTAFLGLVVLFLTSGAAAQNGSPAPSLLEASFSRLPIYFIENRGVYPDGVAYYVRGADKTLFFTRDGITFRLTDKDRGWVVKLVFVGANRDVCPEGRDRQQAVLSYFTGPEKDWKTGLSTYSKVVYEDLWPGIDLVYKGTVHRLKYEFVVKPGAHPEQIRLEYRGATEVAVTDAGGLRVETPVGSFEDEPPVAWQDVDGKRMPVESAFRSPNRSDDGDCGFGFRVGGYDRTRSLILDPALLMYCGYIGGAGSEGGHCGIAVDAAGNAYVTGSTTADERTFPVKVGPDLTYNGGVNGGGYYGDAFVAKVNPQGTGLIYCGYIGGAFWGYGSGIAVDAGGNAYVTGMATSDEKTFPVKGGPDLTFNGSTDAFVAKVNARGTALVYCGYIGGSGGDSGTDIAVDAAGNAYVTGLTNSTQQTFPVKVGPGLTYNGGKPQSVPCDAYVAKIALTHLEGSGSSRPGGMVSLFLTASDGAGVPYFVGTSLGTGPIPIDTRQLDLSPDNLLFVTVSNQCPGIFSGYQGMIDAKGRAQAAIHIPDVPALIGVILHTAFVTVDPASPSGIRSISNTFSFSITKYG